jgi:hypothetical protein
MLVRTYASAVAGIDAVAVTIEVDVSGGNRFFKLGYLILRSDVDGVKKIANNSSKVYF